MIQVVVGVVGLWDVVQLGQIETYITLAPIRTLILSFLNLVLVGMNILQTFIKETFLKRTTLAMSCSNVVLRRYTRKVHLGNTKERLIWYLQVLLTSMRTFFRFFGVTFGPNNKVCPHTHSNISL